jgi:hypothetical protein
MTSTSMISSYMTEINSTLPINTPKPASKILTTESSPKSNIVRHLSLYNLREIIGREAEGIMIYGIIRCGYKLVAEAAERLIQPSQEENLSSLKPLAKVYDCQIGINYNQTGINNSQISINFDDPTGVDGTTTIPQIKYKQTSHQEKRIARQCKAGITNIILHNTLQAAQKKAIVPTIFCVKGSCVKKEDDEDAYEITSESLLSREHVFNYKITIKEVRRAGKLCFDPTIDVRVRQIAQKSIIFIQVTEHLDHDPDTNTDHYTYTLTKIDPPWGTENTSIEQFLTGLKKRSLEKQTDPLGRIFRRVIGAKTMSFRTEFRQSQIEEEREKLIMLIQKSPNDLTKEEQQDFNAFDCRAVMKNDRTFSCLGGKTFSQAYFERLSSFLDTPYFLDTPPFRQQVNEIVQKALGDLPTLRKE